ncbi:MAG: hypothetical protein WBC97_03755 [Gemmatimonadales bacterium]
MGDLKGLAEVVDRLVYEVIGLLLPGAVMIGASMPLLTDHSRQDVFGFAMAHIWLTVGMCYVTGYFVQGISSPVCTVTRAFVALLARISGNLAKIPHKMRRGGPRNGAVVDTNVDSQQPIFAALPELAQNIWRRQLSLSAQNKLSSQDLIDLAYSTLGEERQRLLRFRSAGSLCRGVATIAALAAWTLTSVGLAALSASRGEILLATGLFVAFVAFDSRSRMYGQVWNSAVIAQFVAHHLEA